MTMIMMMLVLVGMRWCRNYEAEEEDGQLRG